MIYQKAIKQNSQLLAKVAPKIIETEAEYQSVLPEVERLLFNKNRTTEEDALYNLLVMLVEKYETENHPLEPAKPFQVLQHLMEARGINESDLLDVLGLKEGYQERSTVVIKVLFG
ncbi:hypothetical protein [Trichormus sp. NMC-1]|uniref:helix-turn-helix domain-containing protein n=1 Tax=Trichormus sp. NMC-1 TaxID=1853259 RepID=UPI0008DC1255|nr:hypothetical protein [Trichormus sp. NMC-1]